MLEAGATMPAVTLADDTGKMVNTKDLLGRVLVLYFYPKDDTPGCTSEAGQFSDAIAAFRKKGAEIVGVSRDSVASHQKFKQKYGIPYRLLADTEQKLCDAFGVIVEKNMYGKTSLGLQRSTFLFDPQGKLVRVWPKVSVPGHAEDVLGRHRVTAAVARSPRASVTVLGSSSSTPRPGRACSCYLVRAGGTAVTLDLGTGSLSNLRRYVAPEDLGAVIISHMHPDHFLDIIPMRYALRYGPRANERRVPLYLPPGGDDLLRRMTSVFVEEPPVGFLDAYDVRTYDPERVLEIGPLRVRFAPTTHFVPTYAIRCDVEDAGVTYTADTALDARVAVLAKETAVFLCESTLLPDAPEDCRRGHMSARDAGELARSAEARRLVLTHYNTETNPMQLLSEARSTFSGDTLVADDHLSLDLG